MQLTREQVQALTGDAERWLTALNNALIRWDINTPQRVAMFLAQCAHESGGFKALVENLNYSAAGLLKTWPSHFTAAEAEDFAHHPERIAERAYGGRTGNGPEGSGDGWRYRGRGIIQLTGRENYAKAGAAIGLDFVAQPELVEQPEWAANSAGWYWATHGCNQLADNGDFVGITRAINGGLNGLDDRRARLVEVQAILDIIPTQPADTPEAGRVAPGTLEPTQPTPQREGGTMADVVNTVAGIASIFNPAAGALVGLAGNLFKAFQPALQQKLTKEIDRRIKDPTISGPAAADIVSTLSQMIVSQAKVQTGETDDFMAVAKAATTPEIKAAIETQVNATLDDYVKMGNAVSTWDNALWAAQNVGKQTVSSIAIEEKKAGVYDMTRLLAWTGAMIASVGSGILLIAVVIQSMMWLFYKEAKGIDPVLLALAGPLLTLAFKGWSSILDYRFDGTKESSDQSKLMMGNMKRT